MRVHHAVRYAVHVARMLSSFGRATSTDTISRTLANAFVRVFSRIVNETGLQPGDAWRDGDDKGGDNDQNYRRYAKSNKKKKDDLVDVMRIIANPDILGRAAVEETETQKGQDAIQATLAFRPGTNTVNFQYAVDRFWDAFARHTVFNTEGGAKVRSRMRTTLMRIYTKAMQNAGDERDPKTIDDEFWDATRREIAYYTDEFDLVGRRDRRQVRAARKGRSVKQKKVPAATRVELTRTTAQGRAIEYVLDGDVPVRSLRAVLVGQDLTLAGIKDILERKMPPERFRYYDDAAFMQAFAPTSAFGARPPPRARAALAPEAVTKKLKKPPPPLRALRDSDIEAHLGTVAGDNTSVLVFYGIQRRDLLGQVYRYIEQASSGTGDDAPRWRAVCFDGDATDKVRDVSVCIGTRGSRFVPGCEGLIPEATYTRGTVAIDPLEWMRQLAGITEEAGLRNFARQVRYSSGGAAGVYGLNGSGGGSEVRHKLPREYATYDSGIGLVAHVTATAIDVHQRQDTFRKNVLNVAQYARCLSTGGGIPLFVIDATPWGVRPNRTSALLSFEEGTNTTVRADAMDDLVLVALLALACRPTIMLITTSEQDAWMRAEILRHNELSQDERAAAKRDAAARAQVRLGHGDSWNTKSRAEKKRLYAEAARRERRDERERQKRMRPQHVKDEHKAEQKAARRWHDAELQARQTAEWRGLDNDQQIQYVKEVEQELLQQEALDAEQEITRREDWKDQWEWQDDTSAYRNSRAKPAKVAGIAPLDAAAAKPVHTMFGAIYEVLGETNACVKYKEECLANAVAQRRATGKSVEFLLVRNVAATTAEKSAYRRKQRTNKNPPHHGADQPYPKALYYHCTPGDKNEVLVEAVVDGTVKVYKKAEQQAAQEDAQKIYVLCEA